MEKLKKYKSLIEEDFDKLEEMSNLFPSDTGINGYKIWITSKSGREKHEARIKVQNSDGSVSIAIWDEPKITGKQGKIKIKSKDWKKIVSFIELNRETLLAHWNEEISSVEFGKRIKSI